MPPPSADELQDAPVAAVSIGTSAQFATLLSPADSASLEAGDAPVPPPASGDGELEEDVEATERAQRRRGNAAWFLAVLALLVSWGMGWEVCLWVQVADRGDAGTQFMRARMVRVC